MGNKKFGKLIKAKRTSKKWTLRQCAEMAGMSASLLFFIENGTRTCTDRNSQRLKEVLEIQI